MTAKIQGVHNNPVSYKQLIKMLTDLVEEHPELADKQAVVYQTDNVCTAVEGVQFFGGHCITTRSRLLGEQL